MPQPQPHTTPSVYANINNIWKHNLNMIIDEDEPIMCHFQENCKLLPLPENLQNMKWISFNEKLDCLFGLKRKDVGDIEKIYWIN